MTPVPDAMVTSPRTLLRWLLTLVIATLTTACSLVTVTSTSQYRDREGAFSGELIGAIRPGETSEEWLFKHFGEPTSVHVTEVGERLLTWHFILEKRSRRHFLFLFDSSTTYQEPRFLHALIHQHNVLAAWVDRKQQSAPKTVQKAPPRPEPTAVHNSSLIIAPVEKSPALGGEEQVRKSGISSTEPAAEPIHAESIQADTDDPLGRRGAQVDDETPELSNESAVP